jgi:hypothetical protein
LAIQKVGCLLANAGLLKRLVKALIDSVFHRKAFAGACRLESYAQVCLKKHKNLVDT